MEGDEKIVNNFLAPVAENNPIVEADGGFIDIAPIKNRSKREKTLAGAIIFIAFIAVFLGYYQLSSAISRPLFSFQAKNSNDNLAASNLAANQDTDKDGLSDYDELNTYKTSPYLEDSDSDGLTDKSEVDSGYDPNCPGQQTCFRSDLTGDNEGSNTPTTQSLPNTQMSQISPSLIRQMLVASGVSETDLANLSDDDLMQMYSEYAAEQGQTQISISNSNNSNSAIDLSNVNLNSVEDLKNLTGAQIRALLVSQGAPQDVLSQVTDDQLKQMFLDKLNEKTQ